MKEGEKFEEVMEQGRQEGCADNALITQEKFVDGSTDKC